MDKKNSPLTITQINKTIKLNRNRICLQINSLPIWQKKQKCCGHWGLGYRSIKLREVDVHTVKCLGQPIIYHICRNRISCATLHFHVKKMKENRPHEMDHYKNL